MASLRGTLVVLHCIYPVSIISSETEFSYRWSLYRYVPALKNHSFHMRTSPLRSESSNSLTSIPLQWLGIFGLLLALLQTPSINIVHFWNHLYILSSSFLIRFSLAVLVVTFFGTALGRMALRTNRSDKMRNFAAYVFVCLVLQVVVGGYLYPCRPFKQDTDEFVNLMRTPEEIFEFTQQPHCVGFSSPVQSDFHGALFEVPGMGTFLLFTLSIV